MKIVEMYPSDVDEFIKLFLSMNKNDPYYNEASRLSNMSVEDYFQNVLRKEFEAILGLGYSYAAVENNKIVGYNILFSLKEMKEYNPEIYKNIFNNADTFRSVCESYAGDTCLIICVGAERQDSYEMTISKLLRKAIEENGYNYNFVTDIVANENLKNIFSKFGFTCVRKNGLDIMERIYSKNW